MFFFLVGCGNSTGKIKPDSLPSAYAGYPYSERIDIGGSVPSDDFHFTIEPEDSGLKWAPKERYRRNYEGEVVKFEDFSEITVYGTPKVKGDIKIHVYGVDRPTMFGFQKYDKKYIIEVR